MPQKQIKTAAILHFKGQGFSKKYKEKPSYSLLTHLCLRSVASEYFAPSLNSVFVCSGVI